MSGSSWSLYSYGVKDVKLTAQEGLYNPVKKRCHFCGWHVSGGAISRSDNLFINTCKRIQCRNRSVRLLKDKLSTMPDIFVKLNNNELDDDDNGYISPSDEDYGKIFVERLAAATKTGDWSVMDYMYDVQSQKPIIRNVPPGMERVNKTSSISAVTVPDFQVTWETDSVPKEVIATTKKKSGSHTSHVRQVKGKQSSQRRRAQQKRQNFNVNQPSK